MKAYRFLPLVAFLLVLPFNVFSQSRVETIDALMKKYFEYGQFNGSILVAEKGKVLYRKGFGTANAEWSIPNQPDTKFRIGSVTKQFTAAVVLQLVQEGKIKLDGRIIDYLPDYRSDTGGKVTIHQLLNHTSGIPSYTNRPGFEKEISRNPYSVADFVKQLASGDLEFEPGTVFRYNNSGYFLLGAIIEKVTGKSFETAVTERIFSPLQMKDSGYDNHAAILTKRASGYEKRPTGLVNAPYLDMSLPYAAGSLYSTVDDLYKWDQALYQSTILSEESKRLMFTPGLDNYGYGFDIADIKIGQTQEKTKVISHSGGINGFSSLLSRVVEKKQTIIILDNVGLGQYHYPITSSIIAILNGQPAAAPQKSIGEHVYKLILDKNVSAAIAEYRKLKAAKSADFDFAESQLNSLGYELIRVKRIPDAIEIFKLNVEMFPTSGNPYDSLGEAYLLNKQNDLGILNYKKSIEIDPTNVNARRIVDRLEGRDSKISPAAFDELVGIYEIAPNFNLTITKENDRLLVQATGQTKLELTPLSAVEFTNQAVKATIVFQKDAAGRVTSLTLSQGGRKMEGRRLN